MNWVDYWFRPDANGYRRVDAPEVREAQRLAEIERWKHLNNDCSRGVHDFSIHGSACSWCLGFVEDITPKYLPQQP